MDRDEIERMRSTLLRRIEMECDPSHKYKLHIPGFDAVHCTVSICPDPTRKASTIDVRRSKRFSETVTTVNWFSGDCGAPDTVASVSRALSFASRIQRMLQQEEA